MSNLVIQFDLMSFAKHFLALFTYTSVTAKFWSTDAGGRLNLQKSSKSEILAT